MAKADYETDGQFFSAEIVDGSKALTAITNAEIDIQISTAKRFPRSVTAFKREAMELATLDAATARSMYYRLPARSGGDGKPIEGASVRLAEIVLYAWGNVRAGARIIAIDHDTVTAQGVCYDLERNISNSGEVKRTILTKNGTRYSPDMIKTTCQAACKIAFRDAVFSVVPRSLFKDVYEEAKLVSVGQGVSLEETRENWLKHYEAQGIKRDQIFRTLNVKGEDDVGLDEVITLAGIANAIKEGETSLELAFSDPEKPAASKVSPLNERVRGKAAAPAAVSAEPAPAEEAKRELAPGQKLIDALGGAGFEPDHPSVSKWLYYLTNKRTIAELKPTDVTKALKALESGDGPGAKS